MKRSGIMQPALLLAILCTFDAPVMAQANDRWMADELQARAALPAPRSEMRFTGAVLSCAMQHWRLDIEATADASATADAAGDVTLVIDGRAFALRPVADTGGLAFRVPRTAIEPLKAGLRLELALPDEALSFSLRGSKRAIAAVQQRCTPRDMSAYTPVTFTAYSSYINLGKELRQADMAAFRQSTASEPRLDVAMVEFDEGRRVFFTRLCGSSWYYGASGCNITGFTPAGQGWNEVYDTESVILHTDPDRVIDGWPDLVTLPAGQTGNMTSGPGLIWRWDGNAYALKGELPDDEPDIPVESRAEAQASGG